MKTFPFHRYLPHVILCGSALLPASLSAAPTIGEVKVFKDWAVACNNIRACEATSFLFKEEGSGELDATLQLQRGGQAQDAPHFSLTLGFEPLAANLRGKPVSLQGGGKSVQLGKLSKSQQKNAAIDIPPAHNAALLELLAKPAQLTISIGGKTFQASLSGLSASLLYMDAQQQRVDATTALVRKGSKPMTAVPPATPVRIAVLAPKGMKAPTGLAGKVRTVMVASLKECDADEADNKISDSDFVEALDAKHYLVGVTCFRAAYNEGYEMFVVAADSASSAQPKVTPAKLDVHSGDQSALVNASFDPKTGHLAEYNKGRGIGDCGTSVEWVWTGKQFEAIRYDEMPECRGSLDHLNLWTAK